MNQWLDLWNDFGNSVVLTPSWKILNIKCYHEWFTIGNVIFDFPLYGFMSCPSVLPVTWVKTQVNSLPVMSPPYRMVPWQWRELQDWRKVGSPGRKWPADELHVSWEWKGRIQVRPPYVILMVSRPLSTLTFLTEPKHSFTGWAGDGGFVNVVVGKSVACFKSESWLNVTSKPFNGFDHLQWSVISGLGF